MLHLSCNWRCEMYVIGCILWHKCTCRVSQWKLRKVELCLATFGCARLENSEEVSEPVEFEIFIKSMPSEYLVHDAIQCGDRSIDMYCIITTTNGLALQWRHTRRHGVSNSGLSIVYANVCSGAHKKKTLKLRVTGLCEGNSPVTSEFPSQRASNAENVSISWRQLGKRTQSPKIFMCRQYMVTNPIQQKSVWYKCSGLLDSYKCVFNTQLPEIQHSTPLWFPPGLGLL